MASIKFFESIVSSSEAKKEVEEKFSGIRRLDWDITNYDKNATQIGYMLERVQDHLGEYAKIFLELSEEEDKYEELIKKEGVDYSGDPWYKMYEGVNNKIGIMVNMIVYLSISNSVLNDSLKKTVDLLDQVKKVGLEKGEVQTALKVLQGLQSTFETSLNAMRENYLTYVNKLMKE